MQKMVPKNFKREAPANRHQRRRHRMILALSRGLRGRGLDYGCGYGDITYLLSDQLDIEGVDVGIERVAFASEQYPELRFAVCGPDGTDYAASSFDVVVSSVVVPFVPDPDSYLQEVHRLLKPGGTLVIASKNIDVLRDRARALAGRGPAEGSLHIMNAGELQRLLCKVGFQVESRDYFYDPPFDSCKNTADVCFSAVRALGALVRISGWAEYYGFRARAIKG